MRIPITQAQERAAFSIIDGARFSLEQVQYLSSIDEDRPLGIETDEVQKFLFYWDQVFLYGLKSTKRGYWNFVSSFSHPTLVNEVKNTPGAVNDLLRSRLWLGTILNDNELENYLSLVQYEQKLLEKYYRPHAILRSRSQLEDLISISCGQENTLFAIHLDYICFREQQLFVGPGDRTSFDKLFDIKFDWDASIRSRSSSSVSVSSTLFSRKLSYTQEQARAHSYTRSGTHHSSSVHSGTPVADLAIKCEDISTDTEQDEVTARDITSSQYTQYSQSSSQYIQYSPTAQLAASNSASPSSIDTKPLPTTLEITEHEVEQGEVEGEVLVEEEEEERGSEVNQEERDEGNSPEPSYQITVIPVTPDTETPLPFPTQPTSASSPVQTDNITTRTQGESRDTEITEESPLSATPLVTVSSTDHKLSPSTSLTPPQSKPGNPSSVSNLVNPSSSPPDYQIALSPGDKLALSPANQEALDNLLRHSANNSSTEDVDSVPSYTESEEEEGEQEGEREQEEGEIEQGVESQREQDGDYRDDKGVITESSQVENEEGEVYSSEIERDQVLKTTRQEKKEELEDLYSDSDPDDLLLPPPQVHKTAESSSPASDPYLLDSGTCSPTLLITDIAPQPSSSSWYDNNNTPLLDKTTEPSNTSWYDNKNNLNSSEERVNNSPPEISALEESNLSQENILPESPETTKPQSPDNTKPIKDSTREEGIVVKTDKVLSEEAMCEADSPAGLTTSTNEVREQVEAVTAEDLNPFGDSSGDEATDHVEETKLTGTKQQSSSANEEPLQSAQPVVTKEEAKVEVPDFSFGSMDRDLGIVIPTQNQKITWAMELFGENEDLCFVYRIWLKDVAGNLELSYFLLSTQMIYLLDPAYLVLHRLNLGRLQYCRGMNWQVISLFVQQEDGTTDQIDVITGCEAISRGIMEGISVNPAFPVTWATEESYSQMRLKYHVNAFLQERGAFSLSAVDDLYYGSVSYLSLTAPPASALHCPVSEGKLWLKEPTLLSYVWNRYYFILDKQGKLSQLDEECAGVIKREYTVIGSGGCRKMNKKETTKQFAFKFTSEEGEEVMLNCDSALERDRWMSAICKAAMEIPQTLDHSGFGMQCSVVISSSYLVMVREGVKSAHTLDSALIQDITEIRWDNEQEMCVITIDKRQWLLLFRDQYEKIKLMEVIWDRWQEIFRCQDLQLLFTKIDFTELDRPLQSMGKYRDYLSGREIDNSEFEYL